MEGKDIRLDKSAEMRAQFATVENYMVSHNFIAYTEKSYSCYYVQIFTKKSLVFLSNDI